jgi:uncharacterized membrane protein YgcG
MPRRARELLEVAVMTRFVLSSRVLISASLAAGALVSANAMAQSLSDRVEHVMQQRSRAQANNQSKSQLLSTLLYSDVTVQFQETPLRDAMKYLETVLGVNLVVRYNDDRNADGSGLDPEAPITLNVENMPAMTVIEMMISQQGDGDPATWQLRDGYIEVGTKERLGAANAREIRYYPIRDLLFEPPQFGNAPQLDLDAALNQGTQSGGGGTGGGGGGGFGGGGGGSGGGGTGGGSGGSIFGESGEDPDRVTEAEKAQQIIDLIVETVEPDAWDVNGGDIATIRYYQGTLIIRAPDYIHRQIGGYPFAARPMNLSAIKTPGARYVTFSGAISNVEIAGIRVSPPFTGSAGGSGSVELPGTTNSGKAPAAAPGTPAKSGGSSGSKP